MKAKIKYGLTIVTTMFSLIGFAHVTDTLKCNLTTGTPTIYPASLMGFISGNNNFGDLEIAQKYGIDSTTSDCAAADSADMGEVAVWFGAKTVGSNDSVKVKIYSVHPVTGAPDLLLSTSFPSPVSVVDTSTTSDNLLEEFVLTVPLLLTDSFFVSLVLPVGDVVGIISNTDGEGQGKRLGWIMQNNGLWGDVLTLRNLDIDFAIFPKPDAEEVIGINDIKNKMDNIFLYPNPVRDNFMLKLESNQNIHIVEMTITDIQGKIIKNVVWSASEIKQGVKRIDTSSLSSGTYYYSIITDREYGNGNFVVVK